MLDSLRGLAVSSCILIAASSGVQCIGTKRSGGSRLLQRRPRHLKPLHAGLRKKLSVCSMVAKRG